MNPEAKKFLVESIVSSRSPKLALNGAKILYGHDESWGEIHRACFEAAWEDATRMNRLIEKKSGNVRWPERFDVTESKIKEEVERLNSSRNVSIEWGRILSTYGENTLLSIQGSFKLP